MQNPPRHQSEAERKCPLLTIADIKNGFWAEFFNSLSHKGTLTLQFVVPVFFR